MIFVLPHDLCSNGREPWFKQPSIIKKLCVWYKEALHKLSFRPRQPPREKAPYSTSGWPLTINNLTGKRPRSRGRTARFVGRSDACYAA